MKAAGETRARWRRRGWVAGLLCALTLAACGEQDGAGGAGEDLGGSQDMGPGRDVAPEEDAAPDQVEEEGQGRLANGEVCEDNTMCEDFLCTSISPDIEERFCSKYCLEGSDCPSDFDCVFVDDGLGGLARVCVPVDLCLDGDGDGYGTGPGCQGRDCQDDDEGVHPGADEVCDGIDNNCDGAPDERTVDSNRDCDTQQEGVCAAGRARCLDGVLVCQELRFATPEVCDGLDNDCDGVTDEGGDGAVMALDCYNGPEGTRGVGACQGGQRRCLEGVFSDCLGQVLPFPELCDGVDNDCDGAVDEDNPAQGVSCDTGLPGACQEGESLCDGRGGLVCVALAAPSEEVCDGVDNDCDGLIDEGEDGEALARACYDGPEGTQDVGPCMGGLSACVEGAFGRCQGQVLPQEEVCDGADNNCDGAADEGDPAGGQLCLTGALGVCARGQTRCTPDGPVCEAELTPSAEVCDGLDNDCDGSVDLDGEGRVLARRCYTGAAETRGVGACQDGDQVCSNGLYGACVGQALPTAERCDGADNDCDGAADEGDPGGGARCSTGQEGVCAAGLTACQGGEIACLSATAPSEEVCDGVDNDCDGLVDEGSNGQPLARSCYNGPPGTQGRGVCAAGAQVCTGGDYGACVGQALPTAERCDGADNDCDGAADEGDPGGGARCSTGQEGVCAAGLTACQGGEIACLPAAAPSEEVCDGLDNDCDGAADEGSNGQPLARSCYDGPPGTAGVGRCLAGVETCAEGQFGACVGQALPQGELCDGLDNDCDGVRDDGDPGGGARCTTGLSGQCALGTTACAGGRLSCQQDEAPQAEVCDGEDNDCDGFIDEATQGLGRACFAGEGSCRRAGVLVCDANDPAGPPVCNAEPGDPDNDEVCNYDDDDCDGLVDEGFRDPQGIYSQPAHCGGCGVDCDNRWPGGPQSYNVAPSCDVQNREAECGFTCVGAYVDIDQIPDNGCEFLPDDGAIYVSSPANGGSDAGQCGAWDAPCATIGRGLDRAVSASRARVRVSDGLYRENVRLRDGVSLLGGHSARTWTRNPEVFVSVLNGFTATPQSADRVAVDASGIMAPTELSGFTINAENAAPGGNSVAVYARDAGNGLLIQQNVIFAGSGGLGVTGARGANGPAGNSGSAGANSFIRGFCDVLVTGSAGGQRSCADPNTNATVNISGGAGGGSNCPDPQVRNGSGAGGLGPQGGGGGLGGGNFEGTVNGCGIINFPADSLPGADGADGSDGGGGGAPNNGAGAVNTSVWQWRGAAGSRGGHGQQGSGGGGGGSAAGVFAFVYSGELYYGATGGGGGSGGCAGGGGVGGVSGGGSFGIKLVFSGAGPSNASQMPRVLDNFIARGSGGRGGDGGPGGAGGDPGLGALGGGGVNQSLFGFCMADGSVGGDGGRGGHGGGGAGGQGGASVDIYVHNSNGVNPGYGQDNAFALANDALTGGAGGQGGNSSNEGSGLGQVGPRGLSANLQSVP
jgi:hypothetical protein